MHITELLKQASGLRFSVEILPKPGFTAPETLARYEPVLQQKPLFVDFPYHAGRSHAGFSNANPTVFKPKPKTKLLAEITQSHYGIPAMPHLLCHGFAPEATERVLLQLHESGIRNLLLLRGDISDGISEKPGQYRFAFQLVEQVKKLNQGINFRNEKAAVKTDFCIGVGGYPEPKNESLERSVGFLKQKVEAGADFIITQFFFDNARFFAFENSCRKAGIQVPVIPGLSALLKPNFLNMLPEFFQVSVPDALQQQLENCTKKADFEQIGIAWAAAQMNDLHQNKVKCVHLFSLAGPERTAKILAGIS